LKSKLALLSSETVPMPLARAGLVFFLEGRKRPINEALAECLEVFKRKFNKDPEVLESEESLYGVGKRFTWRGITVLPSSDLPKRHLCLYLRLSENEDWEVEF
jgi:hypothetical protein